MKQPFIIGNVWSLPDHTRTVSRLFKGPMLWISKKPKTKVYMTLMISENLNMI